MATHGFDTELAKKVGVIPAVIYAYLAYWCEQNRQSGTNEQDGSFWTYHSVRELQETFDYLSVGQIRRGLDTLINNGLVKVGCYNKIGIDRTKWYAVVNSDLSKTTNGLSNLKNGLLNTANGLSNSANAFVENDKAIPIISTLSSNSYINTNKSKVFIPPTVDEVKAYCLERGNSVDPEQFVDFYTSKGWKVGKDKMKDWKASVRTWERNHKQKPQAKTESSNPFTRLIEEEGL